MLLRSRHAPKATSTDNKAIRVIPSYGMQGLMLQQNHETKGSSTPAAIKATCSKLGNATLQPRLLLPWKAKLSEVYWRERSSKQLVRKSFHSIAVSATPWKNTLSSLEKKSSFVEVVSIVLRNEVRSTVFPFNHLVRLLQERQ